MTSNQIYAQGQVCLGVNSGALISVARIHPSRTRKKPSWRAKLAKMCKLYIRDERRADQCVHAKSIMFIRAACLFDVPIFEWRA